MANSRMIIKDIAASMNLKLGKRGTYCHGMYSGYPFFLEEKKSNRIVEFHAMMCACNMGQPIDYSIFSAISMPGNVKIYVSGYKINLGMLVNGKDDDVMRDLVNAIVMITNVLKNNGYTGSDEMGGVYNISLYSLNDCFCFYSIDNASHLEARLSEVRAQHKAKKEKYFLGILGALLGAAIGAGLTLLINALGYYSFWTIIAMSVLSVILYQKFAGKFTVPSAIITGIITLAFSLFIPRLCAAITLYKAVVESNAQDSITFRDCFVYCRQFYFLFSAKLYYFRDVILMNIFGVAGAAVVIITSLKSELGANKVKKID